MRFQPKEYETDQEKKRDFWRGFGGWLGINVVLFSLAACPALMLYDSNFPGGILGLDYITVSQLSWLIPLPINVIALIVLGLTRKYMALGALAAAAVLMVPWICVATVCFRY